MYPLHTIAYAYTFFFILKSLSQCLCHYFVCLIQFFAHLYTVCPYEYMAFMAVVSFFAVIITPALVAVFSDKHRNTHLHLFAPSLSFLFFSVNRISFFEMIDSFSHLMYTSHVGVMRLCVKCFV